MEQRPTRQKLVVQNRRFAILGEPGEHPNLASKVLGLVIRELPALWCERFGYEPLPAETFCDIEARAEETMRPQHEKSGTCGVKIVTSSASGQ
jgi:hypothetical protein